MRVQLEMNERIQKLIEQATETIDVSEKLGIPGTERVFNKEKFAELIIKECTKVAREFVRTKNNELVEEVYISPWQLQVAIEDHFGVKE